MSESVSVMTWQAPPIVAGAFPAHRTYELTLTGALDLAGAPLLDALLGDAIAGGCRDIHLDTAGVSFLDCVGLSVLLTAHARLSKLGGRLVLEEPSWSVRRLVCLADVCPVLGLDASQAAPCRHSGASAPRGTDGARYPAAEPIDVDRPLHVTGAHAA